MPPPIHAGAAAETALEPTSHSASYCADVTKLLAADSFLGVYGPLLDPEAETAFTTLTSLLANPTRRSFFHRVHLIEEQLGPVGKCWKSDASRAEPRPTQPIVMDAEKAASFIRVFRGDEARRAARWLCFQSSDKLMAVFWQDNREDDLKETYDALCAANLAFRAAELASTIYEVQQDCGAKLLSACSHAAAEQGRPLKYAWDDQSIAVAYLAWAYIKGFRYVTGLGPSDVYAVHFTREQAVDDRSGWATQISSHQLHIFPWGDLLAPHRERVLMMDYSGIILDLRNYTRANLGPYLEVMDKLRPYFDARHSYEARRAFMRAMSATKDFAAHGLMQALPSSTSICERKLLSWTILCWHAADILGAFQVLSHGGLGGLAGLYIEAVMLVASREPTQAVADCIHLLRNRWTLSSAVSKKSDILQLFLKEYGIDRGIW